MMTRMKSPNRRSSPRRMMAKAQSSIGSWKASDVVLGHPTNNNNNNNNNIKGHLSFPQQQFLGCN